MLKIIVDFHHLSDKVVSKGAPIFKVTELPVTEDIMRMKSSIPNDQLARLDEIEKKMHDNIAMLEATLR
jgi:V/A-type H+-transporting ATPase subunit A